MKKILVSAIIAIFILMMPFVSLAKISISDSEMEALSAQEGISLEFGHGEVWNATNVNQVFPYSLGWGDPDGFTGEDGYSYVYDSAGYIGYTNHDASSDIIHLYGGMTADIGSNGGVTKMGIGLPGIYFSTLGSLFTIKLDQTPDLTDAQPALGDFYLGAFQFGISYDYINYNSYNEYVIFYPRTTSNGLAFEFADVHVQVPNIRINVSWGDADGWGAASAYPDTGYFGIWRQKVGPGAPGSPDTNNLYTLITLSDSLEIDAGSDASHVPKLNIVLPTVTVGPFDISGFLKPDTVAELNLTAHKYFGAFHIIGFGTTLTGGVAVASH